MTKGRDTAAGNIGSLLDVFRVQQGSGWLRAEYSRGSSLEEGELYVLAGQPIYARSGNLTGYEALNRLLSWQNIYFSFSPDARRPPANIPPALAHRTVTASLRNPTIPPVRISPPYRALPAERSEPFPTSGRGTDSQIEVSPPQHPSSRSGLLPPLNNSSTIEKSSTPGYFFGAEQMIPQKIGPDRAVLTLHLTRRQRFIYFLIDGRRTIGDIARCTNRSVNDVEIVLSELQSSGLVLL